MNVPGRFSGQFIVWCEMLWFSGISPAAHRSYNTALCNGHFTDHYSLTWSKIQHLSAFRWSQDWQLILRKGFILYFSEVETMFLHDCESLQPGPHNWDIVSTKTGGDNAPASYSQLRQQACLAFVSGLKRFWTDFWVLSFFLCPMDWVYLEVFLLVHL